MGPGAVKPTPLKAKIPGENTRDFCCLLSNVIPSNREESLRCPVQNRQFQDRHLPLSLTSYDFSTLTPCQKAT